MPARPISWSTSSTAARAPRSSTGSASARRCGWGASGAPDPFVKEVFARNQATKKPWVKAELCSHLWVARLPADLEAGTHCIRVRVTDEYGREHHDHLVLEVTGTLAASALAPG